MEDEFVTKKRRRAPEGPWRRLTPSLPKKTGVVKNQSMGIDRIVTPAPADTALQIKDDKGDEQRMAANVDETPPSVHIPTPHDEDMTTQ